jgi:flagellar biosynthesis/type III secretory pathway chaperone
MDKHLASLFRSLIDALKDEMESHTRLLDAIREETQALRNNRLPEIFDIGIRKGDAFQEAEAAMQRRLDAVAAISARLGLEDPVSFTQLAACADVQTRQILTGYREKFADIIESIKSANETNRQIIASTLDHIYNGIQFIRNISAPLPHYDRHGQIRAENAHGGILSQAG